MDNKQDKKYSSNSLREAFEEFEKASQEEKIDDYVNLLGSKNQSYQRAFDVDANKSENKNPLNDYDYSNVDTEYSKVISEIQDKKRNPSSYDDDDEMMPFTKIIDEQRNEQKNEQRKSEKRQQDTYNTKQVLTSSVFSPTMEQPVQRPQPLNPPQPVTSKSKKGEKKMSKTKKKKKKLAIVLIVLLILVAMLIGTIAWAYNYILGDLQYNEIDPNADLGINSSFFTDPENPKSESIVNIALFGIDSETSMTGRSDATMILTIDNKHNKIKITSLARDTYVDIEGHSEDPKLTHAYAWGGPELAIQTINRNFNMNISEYVTVNFAKLRDIVDAVGGVSVKNVTSAEIAASNERCSAGNKITQAPGTVLLNGEQALAFCRERYVDSDDGRTQRQRRVLTALFQTALDLSVTEYPSFIKKMMPLCETSLSPSEILGLTPILMNKKVPLVLDAFPNKYINNHGETIGGLWFYVYDLDEASEMLHTFIYDDILFQDQKELATQNNT